MSYMIPYDNDPRDRGSKMTQTGQGRDISPYVEPAIMVAGAGAGCAVEGMKLLFGLLGTSGALVICGLLILTTGGYLPRPDQIGIALNAAADKPAQVANDFTKVGLDATATAIILKNRDLSAANAQKISEAAGKATIEAIRIQTNKDRVAAGLQPLPENLPTIAPRSDVTPLPRAAKADPAEVAFEGKSTVDRCPTGTTRINLSRQELSSGGWTLVYNAGDLQNSGLTSNDVPANTESVVRGSMFTNGKTGITNMNAIAAACAVAP